MLFLNLIKRIRNEFIQILKINNPTAFYTIEDVKMVKEGYLQKKESFFKQNQIRK